MSDLSRIYRARAAECMKLSEIGCDAGIREGFRKLAEAYLKIAKTADRVGAQAATEMQAAQKIG
jgi:hypothetical protein